MGGYDADEAFDRCWRKYTGVNMGNVNEKARKLVQRYGQSIMNPM